MMPRIWILPALLLLLAGPAQSSDAIPLSRWPKPAGASTFHGPAPSERTATVSDASQASGGPRSCGVVLTEGDHLISGARFRGDGQGVCIWIDGTANAVIVNSDISQAEHGIRVTSRGRVVIRDNHIHDLSGNGIEVYSDAEGKAPAFDGNVLIDGNHIQDIVSGIGEVSEQRGPNGNAIRVSRVNGVRIVNNKTFRHTYSGVRVVSASDTVISNNVIDAGHNEIEGEHAAIFIEFFHHGTIISNNQVLDTSSGITVTNSAKPFEGRQAVVTGNRVAGVLGPHAVKLEDDIIFAHNIIDCQDLVPDTWGILAGYGYGRNLQIRSNSIIDCARGIGVSDATSSAQAAWITGNTISGVSPDMPALGAFVREHGLEPLPLPDGHNNIFENNRDGVTMELIDPE